MWYALPSSTSSKNVNKIVLAPYNNPFRVNARPSRSTFYSKRHFPPGEDSKRQGMRLETRQFRAARNETSSLQFRKEYHASASSAKIAANCAKWLSCQGI